MNKNVLAFGNGKGAFDVFFPAISDVLADSLERSLWRDRRQEMCGKVDVRENEKEYIVEVDLPGFKEENIDISIKDRVLTLSCKKNTNIEKKNEVNEEGKKEEEKGSYIIQERSSFEFKRSLSFADNIDEEAITARLENGVLEVRVPKKEERASRQITVNCQKKIEN